MHKHLILFFLISLFGNTKTEICPFSEQTFSIDCSSSVKVYTEKIASIAPQFQAIENPKAERYLQLAAIQKGKEFKEVIFGYSWQIGRLNASVSSKIDNPQLKNDIIILSGPLYDLLSHSLSSKENFTYTIQGNNKIIKISIPSKRALHLEASIINHELRHTLQEHNNPYYCSWKDTLENACKVIGCLAVGTPAAIQYSKSQNPRLKILTYLSALASSYYFSKVINKIPVKNFKSQKYYEWDADEGIKEDIRELQGAILLHKIAEVEKLHLDSLSSKKLQFYALLEHVKNILAGKHPSYTSLQALCENFIQKYPIRAHYLINGDNHPSGSERIERSEERIKNLKEMGHHEPTLESAHVTIIDDKTNMLLEEFTL